MLTDLEKTTSKRIKGFDGLRAIAFLIVFISHKLPTDVTGSLGSVAVWIFFVLSGFLITSILAGYRARIERGGATPGGALLDFYRTRAFRIFPPYYAVLAVLTLLAATGNYDLDSPGRQWSNLLYYSNVYIEINGWHGELGHLWSLAVEQQYYLFFAPLVLFLPGKLLARTCIGLIALSLCANALLVAAGRPTVTFDVNTFVNMGLFGFGGLAGLFASRQLPRWLSNDPMIVILLLGVLALPILLPNVILLEFFRPAVGIMVACLLVQIAQRQHGAAVAVLEWAPLRLLGVISYAAYLFHPMIHSAAVFELFGITNPLHRWIMAGDLAITVLLASASWLLLESPMIRLGRNRRGRPISADHEALQKG